MLLCLLCDPMSDSEYFLFSAAGFAELRNANDANCTYEGDNNVILQQTSNWLLQLWRKRHDIEEKPLYQTPINTISFLVDGDQILKSKFETITIDDVTHPESVYIMFRKIM